MPNNKPAPSSALEKGTSTDQFFDPKVKKPSKPPFDDGREQKEVPLPYMYAKDRQPMKNIPLPYMYKDRQPMKKIPEGNFEDVVYTPKKVKATQDEADVAKNLGIDPMKFAKKRRGMK